MANINKYARPQAMQEAAFDGFTWRWDFSWEDFFGVTIGVNTSQTFIIGGVEAGDIVTEVELHLTTALEDTTDSAFNSITFDFGDDGSATRYFDDVQINVNGTEVIDSYVGTAGNHIYTAAGTFQVTFDSMSGKDLTTINKGAGFLVFRLLKQANPRKNPGPPP